MSLGREAVRAAFFACLGAVATYVATFASPIPYYDDWDIQLVTLSDQPIPRSWFWALHNEHRLPAQRLIQLGIDRLFGPDRRPTILINLVLLTAIATLLLLAVRRIRGFCRSGDAILPLLVLGFAHYASLTWAFAIGWIALVFVVALLLTTITAPTVSHGRLWLAAALIALLPGFGLAGVLLVPPLLALLFLRGDASNTTDAENPASRPGLVVRSLAAIVPAAACIASFIGIELKAPADSVSPIVFLTGLGDFLSTAVGAPGVPLSKERGIVLFVTALAVGLGLLFRARTAADRGGGAFVDSRSRIWPRFSSRSPWSPEEDRRARPRRATRSSRCCRSSRPTWAPSPFVAFSLNRSWPSSSAAAF